MGDTPKQRWAEKMTDAVVFGIDKLARAHAMNDEHAVEAAKRALWFEMRAMIFGLDTRTHDPD